MLHPTRGAQHWPQHANERAHRNVAPGNSRTTSTAAEPWPPPNYRRKREGHFARYNRCKSAATAAAETGWPPAAALGCRFGGFPSGFDAAARLSGFMFVCLFVCLSVYLFVCFARPWPWPRTRRRGTASARARAQSRRRCAGGPVPLANGQRGELTAQERRCRTACPCQRAARAAPRATEGRSRRRCRGGCRGAAPCPSHGSPRGTRTPAAAAASPRLTSPGSAAQATVKPLLSRNVGARWILRVRTEEPSRGSLGAGAAYTHSRARTRLDPRAVSCATFG